MYEQWVKEEFKGIGDDDDDEENILMSTTGNSEFSSVGASDIGQSVGVDAVDATKKGEVADAIAEGDEDEDESKQWNWIYKTIVNLEKIDNNNNDLLNSF